MDRRCELLNEAFRLGLQTDGPAPYLPKTNTEKLPGTIDGLGRGFVDVGSGRWPNSAADK
jgi:hypothetical protein